MTEQQAEQTPTIGIDAEARETALQMINGNRSDAREFIAGHDQPATLALKIVRNLWHLEGSGSENALCDAVLNVQALLDAQDQV